MRKKTVTYDERMTESLSPLVCMACRMYVCKSDVIKRDGEGDGRTFVNQSQLCVRRIRRGIRVELRGLAFTIRCFHQEREVCIYMSPFERGLEGRKNCTYTSITGDIQGKQHVRKYQRSRCITS